MPPMLFESLSIDLLSKQGFTAVCDPVGFRLLDIIGTRDCKTYRIGRIEELITGGPTDWPLPILGTSRPDLARIIQTELAPASVTATFLHDYIAALGGRPAYCSDFTNAAIIKLTFPDVIEDNVSPEKYLESGTTNPGNPIVKEFFLAGVHLITGVLRFARVEVNLSPSYWTPLRPKAACCLDWLHGNKPSPRYNFPSKCKQASRCLRNTSWFLIGE